MSSSRSWRNPSSTAALRRPKRGLKVGKTKGSALKNRRLQRSEGDSDETPSDLHPGDYLVVPQFGLIHLAMKVELEFMV